MNRFHNAAFTLIELLTALTILAIAAALVFPALVRAREKSRQTACSSNLHQIGVAATMYSTDYDGLFVPFSTSLFNRAGVAKNTNIWPNLLKPYTGRTVFSCPSRATWYQRGITWHYYEGANVAARTCGYAMNTYLNLALKKANGTAYEGRAETAIKYPASVVLFCDARAGMVVTSLPDTNANFAHAGSFYPDDMEADILSAPEGATRHNGGANYAFVDGHVRWLKPDAIKPYPPCDGSAPCFGL